MAKAKRTAKGATKMAPENKDFVSTAEAAEELGVTGATLRRWMKEGRIQGHKVGKKWRIRRSDLTNLIQEEAGDEAAVVDSVTNGVARECEVILDRLLVECGISKKDLPKLNAEFERQDPESPHVSRLVNQVLVQAIRSGATDIHLEPFAGRFRIRQRVDGVLAEIARLPGQAGGPIVDKVMRMSSLNMSARRLPQDGRMELKIEGRAVDVRVSVVPSVYGCSCTLRVLDQSTRFDIDTLGLEPDQLGRMRSAIQAPSGLILIIGPSGTGKTWTGYSALQLLNTPDRKLITAEDPVEHALDGVCQIPIRPALGLDFARTLRSMLRQAPNVLFVGEIRDLETAQILCAAALTGHLVISTVHAPDTRSALERLLDLGLPPHKLGSALRCAVAQKLVRTLCKHCRSPYAPTAKELDALKLPGKDRKRRFYKAKGCKHCQQRGYRGRTGVFEILDMNPEMQNRLKNSDLDGVYNAAMSNGWKPLMDAALEKLDRGDTGPDEVARVFLGGTPV